MMLFSTGTGLERVGVVGPDSDCWLVEDAGYWIVRAREGLLLLFWTVDSGYGTSLQKQGRRGSTRASPVVAPMPKSVSFSEEKIECLRGRICLVWRCVSELAYLSPMGWPCIYSGCPISWTVIRGPSPWRECFLFDPISNLVQDIERVIYLR